MRKLLAVVCIVLSVMCQVDYTDQASWTNDACQTGQNQTPINLTGATGRTNIEIYYSGAKWNGISLNSGISYFWQYDAQPGARSKIRFRHTATPTGTNECQEATYTAAQLHFHRSSEHQVEGNYYTAEMHIVHVRDAQYSRCSNMKPYLVVGVFFNEVAGGSDNHFLSTLDITDTGNSGYADIGDHLEGWFSEGVYNYEGSLTTPDCLEVVQWLVCKKVQSISTAQKTAFDGMGASNGSVRSNRDIKTNTNTLYSIDSSYIKGEEDHDDDKVWIPIVFSIIAAVIIVLVVLLIIMCIKARVCCNQKKRMAPEKGFRVSSNEGALGKDVSERVE